jgi:enamine deaminase RidA (YjgF/YER057c/UK114 family)
MRIGVAICVLMLAASPAWAQAPQRVGPAQSPIASSVEIPPGSRLIYISGQVPDAVNPAAADGGAERYGDTKLESALKSHGLGLGDIVMMRVFLVAPPGQQRMDFAGMMRGYRAFFGTAGQPNKPARSTMQVGGLVDPGWLVEIEATAAAPPR